MEKKEKKEKKTNKKEPVIEQSPETEVLEEEKIQLHPETPKEEKTKEQELEEQLEKANKDIEALTEKVKLAQAELINYRRRKDEETASMLKYANQDLITELIEVVDNFERSVNVDDSKMSEELKKYLTGFRMMHSNLMSVLNKYGVEEINRVGQIFNPNEEQALLTESREDLEDEVVIEVLLKGYKLKDRVIRPASVKINQK